MKHRMRRSTAVLRRVGRAWLKWVKKKKAEEAKAR